MRCTIAAATAALFLSLPAAAEVTVSVHYLAVERELPPTLSNLDPRPERLGLDGAAVALDDNATTGRFMGQTYTLSETVVPLGDDVVEAARAALAETPLLVVDGPTEALLAIADLPEADGALIFNATEGDVALRGDACRANVLHTIPSTAMRTDALAQFLVKKRWDDLPLIAGAHPQDMAYASALERSLTKFGLSVGDRKDWVFDADMRRNASQEVPLFTQDLGDYDALLVADELGDFGRYILYNTWEARPIAGSEGLSAVTWAPVVEQWGAVQLQNRFEEAAGREMAPEDYGAWAAVRAIGEAVTRTNSADPAVLRDFLLSDGFELAGFKGRPLTFRAWNGQLRQPIPLVHPRALVALAPLEGFLHQRTELDTLGIDEPESTCTAFN
ncbi:branched-chain amino acid ABC transporter substrate-binding protein [Jannaschia pagri]|uniref:Branched-chain amino acid ABC transporter substrate-binding protein n=1 Tax=Jannaschia pagri TaxID=2829797 RepID=A0ABQ4NIV6_9RHOB|nr:MULTISPECIES: ABC transporter substrate-binding protein [unclassified Jannaschia]GIT89546.1 branched-chain amino acid ABC transporter substrate-binding protein [Jannaschia sp. AI_61]GIT94346.1 branched-chain amino acid ABC transporter substrate-binding protein [Jannaschia sp. AI_62]